MKRSKYFAEPSYYKYLLLLVIPMILQAAVTNFVSLLDNIMVGQIGTTQMSGVSIVNQYIFIFNITIFGAVSGPGIFGAQYYGKGDAKGQRYTVRFRLLAVVLITAFAFVLFAVFKEPFINLFLSPNDSPTLLKDTLKYGVEYMDIILFSLIPFAVGQAYASAIRECGSTRIPMLAAFAAVGINLFLDYALIFGKCGLPEMGVAGAALATVIAKCAETLIMIIWAHTHPALNPYIPGLYRGFSIPGALFKQIIKKSIPLLLNEFLWALGMSAVAQCYSVRGLDVVAARNIAGTLNNMFNAVYVQMGAGIGIVLGQLLGAGRHEEAKRRHTQLIMFSILVSLVVTVIQFPLTVAFPNIYNTEPVVRSLAGWFILIQAFATPIWSYANACYFILRSGGKTAITFLFDFGYTWIIMIPLAYVLCYHTALDIHPLFAIVTLSEFLKVIFGYFLLRTGKWVNTIVN